jgi:ADA HAT complex component 1
MLRLLSWSSGLAADKIVPQEIDYLAPYRHKSPPIDLQKRPMLKRKRMSSPEVDRSHGSPKRRMEKMAQVFVTANQVSTERSSSIMHPAPNTKAAASMSENPNLDQAHTENTQPKQDEPTIVRTKPSKETLRQTLNSQISLEILLKHNELRLIDQEIAKCQIALEQLRRCTEIPYPTTGLSEAVSQGRGPAVRSSRSASQAESPPPWGVTDGPYTRHYAKWLLPYPLFDGGGSPTRTGLKAPAGKTPTKGRSTRGSFADPTAVAGTSRAQRAGKFQALSSGYPQPKDKVGPMIQKRKSDGLLVKLVCLDCRRDNFSSAQGFINHCRIAHGRNFASHDAAADACGEPVDVDEAGAVLGSEAPPSASVAGLVHPLIYSAHLLKQESPRRPLDSDGELSSRPNVTPLKSSVVNSLGTDSTSVLTPSSTTPNLSAMLQRLGATMNLQNLVADMKTPVPVDESSESEEEEEDETNISEAPSIGRHPHLTGGMQPARSATSGLSDISSGSRKGLNHPRMLQMSTNRPFILPTQTSLPGNAPAPYVPMVRSDDLEPSPTNESNQAPSLVDDDGDDEYEAHSPSSSGSGSIDIENRDIDFAVEDGEDSGPSTRNRSTDSDYSGTPKQHPSPAPARRASAFRRSMGGREEKHVSFVSPSPARETEPEKRVGDRRRRRPGSG